MHRYFVKVTVDFTPGPGNLAATCIANRVAYFGFCFTEEHREALLRRLAVVTLKAMVTEGTPVFDAKAAAFFGATGGSSGGNSGGKLPGGTKAPATAKPKAKARGAKAKAKAAGAAAGSAGDPPPAGSPSGAPSLSDPEAPEAGGLSDWSD